MNTPIETTPPRTAAGAKPLQLGEAQIRLLAGTHTNAKFGAIDYHIPPGFAPPPVLHRHTLEDAGWLVLEGDIRFTYEDGTEFLAGPGASTEHPKGCWFRWANAHMRTRVRYRSGALATRVVACSTSAPSGSTFSRGYISGIKLSSRA